MPRRLPPFVKRVRGAVGLATVCSAALAASLGSGSPTGTRAVDVLWRALAGAVLVPLATSAGSLAVLVSACAAAIAAVGTDVVPVAVAAAGIAVVALGQPAQSGPLLAWAGVALAQVVLHLEGGSILDGSTLAAVWVLAPVVAVGTVHLSPGQRRQLRLGLTFGGLALLAGTGLGGVAALSARAALDDGLDHVNAGLDAARRADSAAAAVGFSRAAASFDRARHRLTPFWARPAEGIPIVAQHLRLLRSVSQAGVQLSSAGARAVDRAALDAIAIDDGLVPLGAVRRVEQSVGDAVRSLDRAQRDLEAVDSPWLLPPVKRRLADQLSRLTETKTSGQVVYRVLRHLPALLGGRQPRRYFLAVQTPSEARGSGGIIGNYGELSAEGGRLRLTRFGRTSDLNFFGDPATRVLLAPADYVARWSQFSPETVWQNVTMSPDFPSVASVIDNLYEQSGGAPIDGVIAVDPVTIAALLKVVGPLAIPSWPEPLTFENAERVLLHEQYLRLDGDARIDFLGDTVEALWSRLTTGRLPGIDQLARAVGSPARTKHLLLASFHSAEEDLFNDTGVAGAMAPVTGDFLAVVTQNASENKIDWFLRRETEYDIRVDPNTGDVDARLKVTLRNGAPRDGLPPYVIGSPAELGLPPGDNRLFLSVYTPWEVTEAVVDGVGAAFDKAFERDRKAFSRFVVVPAGGAVEVELTLRGRLHSATYRLDVHRQPGITPDDLTTRLMVQGRPAVVRRVRLEADWTTTARVLG